MSINATLLAQVIVFALLVWFTMKFVWPVMQKAMEERKQRIADGLAAAEQGKLDLEKAQEKVEQLIREAREQAVHIVDEANRRANEMMEDARRTASAEGDRLVESAKAEIEQETIRARDALRKDVATIAVAGASRILEREIDTESHRDLLDKLVAEL